MMLFDTGLPCFRPERLAEIGANVGATQFGDEPDERRALVGAVECQMKIDISLGKLLWFCLDLKELQRLLGEKQVSIRQVIKGLRKSLRFQHAPDCKYFLRCGLRKAPDFQRSIRAAGQQFFFGKNFESCSDGLAADAEALCQNDLLQEFSRTQLAENDLVFDRFNDMVGRFCIHGSK